MTDEEPETATDVTLASISNDFEPLTLVSYELVAVMVTVPGETAVTTPDEETVATDGLLDDHATFFQSPAEDGTV